VVAAVVVVARSEKQTRRPRPQEHRRGERFYVT
jgi:hypothetical protein